MKVKYGEDVPQLSPQFLLSCNYMNEGCDGGWPHFQAYFAQNAHLVSEECAPYQGSTAGQKCSNYEQCKPEAKVQTSYDIGGAYGQTSEKLMMKELVRNGPFNAEFQAPGIFGTYKEGLIDEQGIENLKAKVSEETSKASNLSNKTLADRGLAWTNLNHSVMMVGWGVEDDGKKFWILRNSYGRGWGQDGDFYLRRGNDDFGIESE